MAQVERAAGEQMGGADRREVHADRADGEALVGAADHVHGDGVGIGGERFAAQAGAPGLELPPGRAVGAPRAVAAGAGGVDRGAAGEFFQLGGAGGAVGHGERAEQAGLQGQRSGGRRGRGPGRGGGLAPAAASGGAVSGPPGSDRPAWRVRSSESAMAQVRTPVLRPQSRIIGRNCVCAALTGS